MWSISEKKRPFHLVVFILCLSFIPAISCPVFLGSCISYILSFSNSFYFFLSSCYFSFLFFFYTIINNRCIFNMCQDITHCSHHNNKYPQVLSGLKQKIDGVLVGEEVRSLVTDARVWFMVREAATAPLPSPRTRTPSVSSTSTDTPLMRGERWGVKEESSFFFPSLCVMEVCWNCPCYCFYFYLFYLYIFCLILCVFVHTYLCVLFFRTCQCIPCVYMCVSGGFCLCVCVCVYR